MSKTSKAPKLSPWATEAKTWCIGKSAFVCLKPRQEKALAAALPGIVDRATFRDALKPYVDAWTLTQMANISEGRLAKAQPTR